MTSSCLQLNRSWGRWNVSRAHPLPSWHAQCVPDRAKRLSLGKVSKRISLFSSLLHFTMCIFLFANWANCFSHGFLDFSLPNCKIVTNTPKELKQLMFRLKVSSYSASKPQNRSWAQLVRETCGKMISRTWMWKPIISFPLELTLCHSCNAHLPAWSQTERCCSELFLDSVYRFALHKSAVQMVSCAAPLALPWWPTARPYQIVMAFQRCATSPTWQ